MLRKLLLIVVGAFVGVFAFAQNTPETATVIDDLSTYEGTDAFVFNKADRKVYAYNTQGAYEQFGVYEKVYTLKTEVAEGEQDYIYSEAPDGGRRNAYIKTDYIPKANTRAIATAYINSRFVHDWNAIFGVGYDLEGWHNLFTFFGQTNYGRGGVQTRVADGNIENMFAVPWGRVAQYEVDAAKGMGTVYDMNGTVLDWVESQVKDQDCVTPMYIFAMNKTKPAYSNEDGEEVPEEEIVDCHMPFMKLFGLKVYEGETLVRDFVPYVQDGVAGVYDNVNSVFWPQVAMEYDGEEGPALKAGTIAAYEGKIVRLATDNHVYKYTGGAWQDCGEPSFEEIADATYKDMSTWKTNDGHMGIYQDQVFYDEDADENYIDNYVGTGGFEPLMTQVEVEKGADYKFSFDYMNASGSNGWSNWYVRSAVWNGYDLNTSSNFAFPDTDNELLASHVLGNDASFDYVPIEMDFTAAKDKETILVQFGMYNDGIQFSFEFNHFCVAKYIYPELYPEIDPDSFAEVEPTRWDTDGVGYAVLEGGNGNNANESFGKILDNDASTKFCGSVAEGWFIIKAEKPVVVKQYSIVTGADTYTYGGRNPRAWTLEGSNDQKTWELIDKVEDYDLIEMRNSEEFVFVPSYVPEEEGDDAGAKESTSTEPFQYFRFTVNAARDGVQIGEFWINEQAHEWGDVIEDVAPTCCVQGRKVTECSDCKTLKTEWIAETNDHDYGDDCNAGDFDAILVFDSNSRENAHHVKCNHTYQSQAWDAEGVEALTPGWTEVDFDDTDWATIALPFGDQWDANAGVYHNTWWNGEYNAYQLRFPFTIEDASKVEELVFQSYHDDDYWVFLNGELILQVGNWNGGNFRDFANWDMLSSSGDSSFPNSGTENVVYAEPIPLDLLQDGENVLAVYVQQNWGGRMFDCRLGAIGDVKVVTGVKEVETAKTGAKDVIYDLQGRMMTGKNLPKGIYIVNGKKQVVK